MRPLTNCNGPGIQEFAPGRNTTYSWNGCHSLVAAGQAYRIASSGTIRECLAYILEQFLKVSLASFIVAMILGVGIRLVAQTFGQWMRYQLITNVVHAGIYGIATAFGVPPRLANYASVASRFVGLCWDGWIPPKSLSTLWKVGSWAWGLASDRNYDTGWKLTSASEDKFPDVNATTKLSHVSISDAAFGFLCLPPLLVVRNFAR